MGDRLTVAELQLNQDVEEDFFVDFSQHYGGKMLELLLALIRLGEDGGGGGLNGSEGRGI